MSDRRPLKSRNTKWAATGARTLFKVGLTPNVISILSIVFAALSCWSFACSRSGSWSSLLFAAIFIQMRLLCNLLDGMVAIEHGLKSNSGEIYNDFPDRIADLLIIVGAAYAIPFYPYATEIGWLAGSLAVLTAYVRVLGKSVGAGVYFVGPMAKPHRMATLTIAAIITIFEQHYYQTRWTIWGALVLISVGALIATFRRLFYIIRDLEGNSKR